MTPKARTPRLSQSIARVLLQQSPLHAWWSHRDLGGLELKQSRPMDLGTLTHELLLGGDRVVIVEADDWRKAAAREERDALRAAGKTPVLPKDHDQAECVAGAIRDRLDLEGLPLDQFICERRIEWTQDGVECEGTPDMWSSELALLCDLKIKGKPGSRESRAKSYATDGLAIQAAAYIAGMETLCPELAGRIEWRWIAAEWSHPYDVVIDEPSAAMLELGRRQWARARREWKHLLSFGWAQPWSGQGVGVVDPPAWALEQA